MQPYGEFPTVPELLDARAKSHGDRLAVSFEGTPCTFEELNERADRVHAWLSAAGVRPGESVALLMRNSLEFLYAWLGAAKAGAVSIPVNTAMVGEALAYNLEHSEAVGLIADADLLDVVAAAGSFPGLRWRVARGGMRAAAGGTAEPFEALLDPAGGPPARPDLTGASPMSIVYTSGTTGMPKGVVLPHQSFTNTGAYFAHHLRFTPDDRLHTCLPLFHCNAQQCSVMAGLSTGIPVAVNERFSVSRFWSWIAESQATVTNLLGTMLTLLAKAPAEAHDATNTLRLIVAAPIPEQLYAPLETRFGVRLLEGYGLTETGTMACINPVDDVRPGTIGLPLEHNELRIVDERDRGLPDETPGEIVTRSHIPHATMSGYFKEPEKTAEAMRGGWFHTGDLGKRRADGYFVFLDRLKDTIRRRGENISSFLVEKVIAEYPAASACAVVGVPSELGEEDVKAVVVLRDGAACEPGEIVDWCATRMADFMVPRYVELRAELPLTETGRVHKFRLRAEGIGPAWDRLAVGSTQ
ncbi:MAG: AMP-binding protein [Acidimicrobiia bacterium]